LCITPGIQQLQELADNILEPSVAGGETDEALRHMLKQVRMFDLPVDDWQCRL
jgi:hypothetical protein